MNNFSSFHFIPQWQKVTPPMVLLNVCPEAAGRGRFPNSTSASSPPSSASPRGRRRGDNDRSGCAAGPVQLGIAEGEQETQN